VKTSGTPIRGYTIKDGKVIRIAGFGQSASAKIAARKSKKVRPAKPQRGNN